MMATAVTNINTINLTSNTTYDFEPGKTYTLNTARTFKSLSTVTLRRKPGVSGPNPIIRFVELDSSGKAVSRTSGQVICLRFEKCVGISFQQIDWQLQSRAVAINLDGCSDCIVRACNVLPYGDGNAADDGNGFIMIRSMPDSQSKNIQVIDNSCFASLTGNWLFTGLIFAGTATTKPNLNIQIKRNRLLAPPRGEHMIRMHGHEDCILEDNYVDARKSVQKQIMPMGPVDPATGKQEQLKPKGGCLNIRDGKNLTVKRGRYWGPMWIGPLQITVPTNNSNYPREAAARLNGLRLIGIKLNGWILVYRGASNVVMEDSCVTTDQDSDDGAPACLSGKPLDTFDTAANRPKSSFQSIRCKFATTAWTGGSPPVTHNPPLKNGSAECDWKFTDCTFEGTPITNT